MEKRTKTMRLTGHSLRQPNLARRTFRSGRVGKIPQNKDTIDDFIAQAATARKGK
jgi:hypothetical protein